MTKPNCGWTRSNSVWEEKSASGALINAKYFETYQKKFFWHFEVELYALGCKMLLITFPSLKIISAMRYHSQGWKLLLYYSLCCQECQKGQSGHTSRGECKMEELKL